MTIPKDGYDRLKNVSFWHWEYQRRNPEYRRWCEVVERYINYFAEIGEWEYMCSLEFAQKLQEYYSDPQYDDAIMDNPYCQHLEREYGLEAKKAFFKWSILGFKFDQKFKRIFRDPSIGMNTEEALANAIEKLSKSLTEEPVSFEVESLADMTAMLKMHHEWIIQIDGNAPSHVLAFAEDNATIPINPDVPLERLGNIGHEAQVLNMFHKALYEEHGEQVLDEATPNAAYQLSIAGKHINNSDLVRLAVLWMWDQAFEANPEDLDAGFMDAYEQITAKIVDAQIGGDKPFNQFLTHRKRIQGYFSATDRCIKNMHVFNLNN